MEDIRCIFCNQYSNQVVIEENGYTGKRCSLCGLIFVTPMPSYPELSKIYVQSHRYAETHIGFKKSKQVHAKHTLTRIKNYKNKGSLLELGAGAGYFLLEAKKQGFSVYGIEPNKIEAIYINEKLKINCESLLLNENSFEGRTFDIIYHCDVLSHFYSPINEFSMINKKLNDDGILVFETGNTADVKNRYYRYFSEFGYPDHLFLFGENSLRKLLEQTDFEIVETYKYSNLLFLIIHKLLWRFKDTLKDKPNSTDSIDPKVAKGTSVDVSTNKSKLNLFIRNCYRYLAFFLKYKIGSIMPKKGRPQTVIIIAQKR